jgi:hypothetical protein
MAVAPRLSIPSYTRPAIGDATEEHVWHEIDRTTRCRWHRFLLIVGLGWYEMRWAKPRTVPATATNSVSFIAGPSAEPPGSALHKRGAQSVSKDTEGRETAVCGMGTVPTDPHEQAAPFNYVDRLTGAAQKRWRKSLLDSDDNHERAAGLMLQSEGWDFDPMTKMPARTHGAALARDELVQLAAGLNGVSIYAIAMRACDPADDGGVRGAACLQISDAKWATMDPDNTAPWLEMAVAAHARADRAAEVDAVSHAVRAHSVNFYNDSLLAYATPGMPPETSTLERAAFFDGLIGNVRGASSRLSDGGRSRTPATGRVPPMAGGTVPVRRQKRRLPGKEAARSRWSAD